MYLFKRVADLQNHLRRARANLRSVGFVPTMGALHEGHLHLIRRSLRENQITVCSIFVNPTQFNDADDLRQYPRMPGKDLARLAEVGCDIAFLPFEEEIYPPGLDTRLELDFQGLDTRMEGSHRPGHFAGVAQVVKRLLDIVNPNTLYLGQKDYQQVAIVKSVLEQLQSSVQVVSVPTVREADGLAMSSRNSRLTEEARLAAPLIYHALQEVKKRVMRREEPLEDTTAWALHLLSVPPLRPEYLEVVDGTSLQPLSDGTVEQSERIVACTAVWAGDVRLIDNIIIKSENTRK